MGSYAILVASAAACSKDEQIALEVEQQELQRILESIAASEL